MMSDILPTSYQAAEMAGIHPGDTVAVFGCGPVGMLAIACAQHMGAGRVFAVDQVLSRLEMARKHGAEAIDFSSESPTGILRELTQGSGPDRVIDAVGIDATTSGARRVQRKQFEEQMDIVAPKVGKAEGKWWIGGAPTQALEWAVESVAKAGDAFDYWRVSADAQEFSHWHDDEQESDRAGGELQSPQVPAAPYRTGAQRRDPAGAVLYAEGARNIRH